MSPPTYGEHISRAARYAALALNGGPPERTDVPLVLVLRDDVVDNLAGLVRDLADRHQMSTQPNTVVMLARDPVGALATRLSTMPRLGAGWEDRPSPAARYAGRPADPAQAHTAVAAWTGLAVDTLVAGAAARHSGTRPDDAARWTALGDVAVLAEAVDALDHTLAAAGVPDLPGGKRVAWRHADAALALEAREVAALALGTRDEALGATAFSPGRPGVIVVSRLSALPPAAGRLAELLRQAGPDATASALVGAAVALARTSLACAQALDAAARHPAAASPEMLHGTAAALHSYGTAVQPELARAAPGLGSVHRDPMGLRYQTLEIGGEGARRIADLVPRPAAALAASADLLEFAARIPAVTDALADTVDEVHRAGRLFVRDRSEGARQWWVTTRNVDQPAPLVAALHAAADVAASAPPAPRAWTPPPVVSPCGPVADLRDALARRRAAQRPTRPGQWCWTAPQAPGI